MISTAERQKTVILTQKTVAERTISIRRMVVEEHGFNAVGGGKEGGFNTKGNGGREVQDVA